MYSGILSETEYYPGHIGAFLTGFNVPMIKISYWKLKRYINEEFNLDY